MVRLKISPKNLELDINLAKTGNSAFFRDKQQILRQWRILRCSMKIGILLALHIGGRVHQIGWIQQRRNVVHIVVSDSR